jgi:hypothetical protein
MYVFCLLLLLMPVTQQQRAHDPLAKKNTAQKPNTKGRNQQSSSNENGVSSNYQIDEPQKKAQQEQRDDDFDKSFQRVYWGTTILGVGISLGFLFALIYQNKLTRKTANAARVSADALINSERAWVLTQMGWDKEGACQPHRIVRPTDNSVHTLMNVRVVYRNYGRTPAWITEKHIKIEVTNTVEPLPDFSGATVAYNIEPIAGEQEPEWKPKNMTGEGWGPDSGQFTLVYGLVKYRDVFGEARETRFGYILVNGLFERMAHPEYNKNT